MKKQILVTLLLLLSFFAFSQKGEVLEGDWKNLQGITQYNVVFEYENIKVNRFETEEEFLTELTRRFEDKNKSKTQKTVREKWFDDRKNRYEPRFIESFNKRFDNNKVFIDSDNKEASHTVLVKTEHIIAGITNGTMNKASKLDVIVTVFKNDDPKKSNLLAVKYKRIQGNSAIPIEVRPGLNVAECYSKLGKEFAQKLRRKAW